MNFLFIIACLVFVITVSYLLHRYHLFERQQARKRSLPLPPLGSNNLKLIPQTIDIDENYRVDEEQPPLPITTGTWQKSIAAMKKNGEFEGALNLCKSKFPLYSAYRQATLILRSVLQTESLSNKETEENLLRLYKTAVTAEMIHMKKSAEDTVSSSELKKLNKAEIDSISIDYNILGYLEIPLLTKKDIKTIVSLWGEPKKHNSPSKLYQKYINELPSLTKP